MNKFSNNLNNPASIVLKNLIVRCNKVIILHQHFGKINVIFQDGHQAAQLTTGSLILSNVEKQDKVYKFLDLDVIFIPIEFSMNQLIFLHDIVRLCLHLLPSRIKCPELFDYLMYVYGNVSNVSEYGKKIIMLRLFLLFDMVPDKNIYIHQFAVQDPYNIMMKEDAKLDLYLKRCWDRFYSEQKTIESTWFIR